MTEVTTPAPRGVPAALTALALGAFGIGIAEMTVTGLLGQVAAELHASTAAVGTAISLYAFGVVVGAPLITIAGARMSRHRLLLGTLTLFIAGNTAALLAPNLPLFCLARFVAGLPHGAYLALAAATAASLVPRERRGRATARVGIGQTIASILGVPLAIFLGQALSWRAALALAVVVFVAAFAAVLTFVPRDSGTTPQPPAIVRGTGTLSGRVETRQIIAALRSPALWAGFAVAASAFAGLYCVLSFIAPITTDVAGLSAGTTPVVLMLYGAGMTVGAIAGGRAADWDVARAVPIGGIAAGLVLAGFAAVMSAPWAPFAGAFAIGLVQLFMFPSLQLRLMDAAPHAPAVAAALNQSAVNLANVIGTSAGGALLATGLGYPANGYAGALLAATGAALAFLLRPRPAVRERAGSAR